MAITQSMMTSLGLVEFTRLSAIPCRLTVSGRKRAHVRFLKSIGKYSELPKSERRSLLVMLEGMA